MQDGPPRPAGAPQGAPQIPQPDAFILPVADLAEDFQGLLECAGRLPDILYIQRRAADLAQGKADIQEIVPLSKALETVAGAVNLPGVIARMGLSPMRPRRVLL
jgi:hypothetical protein